MTGNIKDFATGIVVTAPSPANSGTSLTLQSGEGARMPTTPFSATAHPASEFPTLDNSERINVTDVAGDVLTISRAQGDATAKNIEAGWRVSNSLFADNLTETDPVFSVSEAAGFVAGDAAKLAGIEANADVTDATNVAAAGAIMDGDFSTNGLMKRTGAGTYGIATSTDYVNGFADPNADRIVFWDDSAGTYAALTASTGLTLSGTNLTVRSASSTATGIAELATDAETVTGTDTGRVTTPANLTAKMAAPGNIGGTTPGTGTFTTATATTVVAHTISEKNFGNGVTIDGALIKDGAVTNPATSAPATPAEGMLWWDTDDTSNPGGDLATDHISEVTSGHGVAVDGVTLKDGDVTGATARLQTKIITATRDAGAASADVTYTGVGFTPTSIKCFANVDAGPYQSIAESDSTKTAAGIYTSASGVQYQSAMIASYTNYSSWAQNAVIKSYNADGFTLTWTKVGTPTAGTIKLSFVCKR